MFQKKQKQNNKKVEKGQNNKEKKCEKKAFLTFLLKFFSGVFLGFINGFFGGGGGMISVPILNKLFALKKQKSHASSIAVILPLSLVSGIVYLSKNNLGIKNVLFAGFSLAIGGGLGAIFLKKISTKTLKIIFAVLMFAAGLSLVII